MAYLPKLLPSTLMDSFPVSRKFRKHLIVAGALESLGSSFLPGVGGASQVTITQLLDGISITPF